LKVEGFSLVEVLVSVTLVGVLLVTLYSSQLVLWKGQRTLQGELRWEQEANWALERICSVLRSASEVELMTEALAFRSMEGSEGALELVDGDLWLLREGELQQVFAGVNSFEPRWVDFDRGLLEISLEGKSVVRARVWLRNRG
jgi:prepilin-type N-terminal cleavage/methylation domain-containing protein